MNPFEIVTKVFQSQSQSEAAANRCSKAYADGVGHPEYHKEISAAANPEFLAVNLAGLYAADSAAIVIAGLRMVHLSNEEAYVQALRDLERA